MTEIMVLRLFVKEFSPLHQTDADSMNYWQLMQIVKEVTLETTK